MFYTLEKLTNRIHELKQYRYRGQQGIVSFKTYEPPWDDRNQLPNHYSDQTLSCGQTWSGRDRYLWLQADLGFEALESAEDDADRFIPLIYLDLGRTGGGNNSGFESLIYVNKHAIQAVDSNHKEVFLRDIRKTSYGMPIATDQPIQIDIQLWSGLEGGGIPRDQTYEILEAWYGWLDKRTDAFYFRAKAILDSIVTFSDDQPEKHQLLQLLNQVMNGIDWTSPGNGEFYASVDGSSDLLTMGLEALQGTCAHSAYQVMTIGHSHIDLAWLWQLHHTKEKAKRSFSTVLQLMASDQTYTYLQSQPQIYAWIEAQDPELFEAIASRIQEGRWVPEGAMWVEADCNIPSGESLVRQLFYGKRYFKDRFGKDNRVLWLPDVFGYSWALPQILKKSGVECFVTTKISWNQYNRMPADTFIWRGIDGTEIPTHFITTPEPGRPSDSWFYTYNGHLCAETAKGIWRQYRQKDLNTNLLLAYGYGDGGGGPNREMLAMQKYLNEVPGMPKVSPARFDQYFEELGQTLDNAKSYVHTWDGELYLEYHRGTYTSQAQIKYCNRRMEMALMALEAASVYQKECFASGANRQADVAVLSEIENLWKQTLLLQFHDILPGSSIPEVYKDAHAFYKWALPQIEDMIAGLLTAQNRESADKPTERNGLVFNPTQLKGPMLVTLQEGDLRLVPALKPFGMTPVASDAIVESNEQPLARINRDGGELTTDNYIVHWNQMGQLTRLYDLVAQREMLLEGGFGNQLMLYEDKPMAHDAWDIDLYYIEKAQCLNTISQCRITIEKNSNLEAVLVFKWSHAVADITQRVVFYSHTKRIDFKTEVAWRGRQKLLKVGFDLNLRAHEAIFDIQFGNVKRPNHWNTSWDMAKFETVGHHWAALSEPNYGIALLNDSKYGYSALGNTLALSLLKGATYPDPLADMGDHSFTYALFPFDGPSSKFEIAKEGIALNAYFQIFTMAQEQLGSLFDIIGEGVIIDAVKCAASGGGYILRMHEMEGNQGTIKVKWHGDKIKMADHRLVWRTVDLLENPLDDITTEGSDMTLSFKPYEIKTLQVSYIEGH